jgi:hypothetical protein
VVQKHISFDSFTRESSVNVDEIFEYIFFKAGMNKPHDGIVYMTKAPRTTTMNLPEIDAKNSEA